MKNEMDALKALYKLSLKEYADKEKLALIRVIKILERTVRRGKK